MALVVRVTDTRGNAVVGEAVTFSVVEGGGAVFPGVALTNAQGQAETTATVGASPGANVFQAEATGVPPVRFTARGRVGGNQGCST